MPQTLPRLRMDLDFMPSPLEDRPGLLIRDPYQYTDTTLIIPPPLIDCLHLFDGEATDLDLRAALVRVTGELDTTDLQQHLISSFRDAGFLDDEVYSGLRQRRHRQFAEAPTREATHAGSAYPEEPDPLRATLNGYLGGEEPCASGDHVIGIAAPHVSPEGGWKVYKAAYRALNPAYADRVFVILGTSHYGPPDRFGLTRKPFVTPLGEAPTEVALVDRLAQGAPGATEMEDYCHAAEHSIEFQVIFLQHIFGPNVRILPILCGSYARSIHEGGRPEDNEDIRRFIAALGEVSAREAERLCWVLGVDMAHMGRRYGDPFNAQANQDTMVRVAERDRARCECICAGDAGAFWELVQENRDDLKWCGATPLYTFLRAVPEARARLLDYQQWNIDDQSVVSFGAMAFSAEQSSDLSG